MSSKSCENFWSSNRALRDSGANLAVFHKAAFAAPESFLPSLPTAFASHACFLHLLIKLVLAAPASGLPYADRLTFASGFELYSNIRCWYMFSFSSKPWGGARTGLARAAALPPSPPETQERRQGRPLRHRDRAPHAALVWTGGKRFPLSELRTRLKCPIAAIGRFRSYASGLFRNASHPPREGCHCRLRVRLRVRRQNFRSLDPYFRQLSCPIRVLSWHHLLT